MSPRTSYSKWGKLQQLKNVHSYLISLIYSCHVFINLLSTELPQHSQKVRVRAGRLHCSFFDLSVDHDPWKKDELVTPYHTSIIISGHSLLLVWPGIFSRYRPSRRNLIWRARAKSRWFYQSTTCSHCLLLRFC